MARQYRIRPRTIYIGGGTPSILEVDLFRQLEKLLRRNFDLQPCEEWTIESNPESIDNTKVQAWQMAGVTRVSMGVQSLHNDILRGMRRRHTAEMVTEAAATIQSVPGVSLGLDLISGYPGVTHAMWCDTVANACALQPAHISVYDCTVYRDTHLFTQIKNRAVDNTPMAAREQSLQLASDILRQAGYEQYETSNFAKPGLRCHHNEAVWRGEDYIGFGPSAASRIGRLRWTNPADLDAYMQNANHRRMCPSESEELSVAMDCAERLMFAFRLREPVSIKDYLPADQVLAHHLETEWEQQLAALCDHGLVAHKAGNWSTTAKGHAFADLIAEALLPG